MYYSVTKSETPSYGDHIFSCRDAHKTKLSNAIQDDTIAKFLQVLEPLAGFTNSPG
jgi:hypothetical protein